MEMTQEIREILESNSIYLAYLENDPEEPRLEVQSWDDIEKAEREVAEILPEDEREGFSLDDIADYAFMDEHDRCSSCGMFLKTSPDCYGWTPNFYVFSEYCELLCLDCVEDEDMIEDCKNNERKAIHKNILTNSLEFYGWKRIDQDFENGFHPGQNDNPAEILKENESLGRDVVFCIDSVGQFDVRFSAYYKEEGGQ